MIEALCNSVEGCDSYGFYENRAGQVSLKFGILGTTDCRQNPSLPATNAGQPYTTNNAGTIKYRTHVKTTYQPEQCPLGLGVEVIGGPPALSAMRGLYEADLSNLVDATARAPKYYKHVDRDLGNYNYIAWHISGCGWVGLMHNTTYLAALPPPDTCADDDVLANTLIGQCNDPATCATSDPDYEVDICKLIDGLGRRLLRERYLRAHLPRLLLRGLL